MFRNLLRPDSPLMITVTQITDCIFLSLFWLLGCFPVITIGASMAALYDATYRTFRKGEKHSWQRFAHVYRENWKQSILPTVIFLVLMGVLVRCGILLWNNAVYGNISWGMFSGLSFVLLLPLGMGCILFPLLSRFETGTAQLFSNAFRLGFVNLPLTLALALLNGVTALLCVRFVFPLFFLPALSVLIGSLFLEPMFKPYMPKEDPEDAA